FTDCLHPYSLRGHDRSVAEPSLVHPDGSTPATSAPRGSSTPTAPSPSSRDVSCCDESPEQKGEPGRERPEESPSCTVAMIGTPTAMVRPSCSARPTRSPGSFCLFRAAGCFPDGGEFAKLSQGYGSPSAAGNCPMRFDQVLTGDCLHWLERLPEGSIDLGFADPPFNIGYEYDVYDDRRGRRG